MPRNRPRAASPDAPTLVWILPDQLARDHPALRGLDRARARVLLIESRASDNRLPFHKKRLVLIKSAGRHYAEELRRDGWDVEVRRAGNCLEALVDAVRRHRPARLLTMAASEYHVRDFQRRLPELLDPPVPVEILPDSLFLVSRRDPPPDADPDKRHVMEPFYRSMRKHFNILLDESGRPEGGAWNFDAENRKRLPDDLDPPDPPRFPPDDVTRRVMDEVAAESGGVGDVDGFDMAVARADAEAAFRDFLARRLPRFGPYEDAMTARHDTLFHSVLSPQMNLGLLDPLDMARAAEAEFRAGRAPIPSVEGFVRQIVGWREYIYWQYWLRMPGLRLANHWDGRRPMPRPFWDGGRVDMACLRAVVARVERLGFSHHIERLMLVCNFCLLAGVRPADVADWFLAFYVDSHDWVVLPNVLGMGMNADGGLVATKPYIASANYVNAMSDYCRSCRYSPKARVGPDACPFNTLYWNFLLEREPELRRNPRLGKNVLGLRHLSPEERARVREEAAALLDRIPPYAAPEVPPVTLRMASAPAETGSEYLP